MKKILLCFICIITLVFGVYSTVVAVDEKTIYNENMAQIVGYVADDYYSVKNMGHLQECKNKTAIASSNIKKYSFVAGCMYFVAVATGGTLIFITIKNRKEYENVQS